jgi:hypothetical protein
MTWQHIDSSQFEIVSEAYLRDKMGCSFLDRPGSPRCVTFPDGTVLNLHMTSSGLGFGRFTKPDLSSAPMTILVGVVGNQSPVPASILPAVDTNSWDECCVAMFGDTSSCGIYTLLSSNALLSEL